MKTKLLFLVGVIAALYGMILILNKALIIPKSDQPGYTIYDPWTVKVCQDHHLYYVTKAGYPTPVFNDEGLPKKCSAKLIK